MDQLEIRQGTWEDIDELENLYRKVSEALERGVNYPGWEMDVYPARKDAEKGLKEGTLHVAVCGGALAGAVILNHEQEDGYDGAGWKVEANHKEVFVVHTLAIHPDYQKRGLGKAFLQYAEDLGRKQGIKAIRLDVVQGNEPAVRLYETCGYDYIGTVDLGHGDIGLPWFRLYEKSLEEQRDMAGKPVLEQDTGI